MAIINKITKFIRILVFGQEYPQPINKPTPAIKNQCLNVKRIWKNKYYNDFGLERIIRLALALSLFSFPGLYIRHYFGKYGLLERKLGVELYVLIKLLLPIFFFMLSWNENLAIAIFSSIMAFETIIYLTSLIFLSNEFTEPISYRRSFITLIINYIEVCLNYGVVYSYCNYAIPDFFNSKLKTALEAVYFSFVTSATVGYGDIVPNNALGRYLVISQIILFLVFVALFINVFASKVQDPTYYNSKSPNRTNRQKPKKRSSAR